MFKLWKIWAQYLPTFRCARSHGLQKKTKLLNKEKILKNTITTTGFSPRHSSAPCLSSALVRAVAQVKKHWANAAKLQIYAPYKIIIAVRYTNLQKQVM